MPVSVFHRVKDFTDKFFWNFFMKKIAHRIDKNHARFFPLEWLQQSFWPQRQIKTIFKWMSGDAAPAFRKSRRVAVVTTHTYFRAACDRIPCRVSPFD